MTDLLIMTLLSGMAITYIIEVIEMITGGLFGVALLNRWLTLPLSFGALYSQFHFSHKLIVAVPASTFLAIAISKYINKPTVVTRVR